MINYIKFNLTLKFIKKVISSQLSSSYQIFKQLIIVQDMDF